MLHPDDGLVADVGDDEAVAGSPLPPLDALPGPMAAEVRRLREHEAGRFAARLYEQERHGA